MLGRVQLQHTTARALTELYGRPSQEHYYRAENRAPPERENRWKFKDGELRVFVFERSGRESTIYSVEAFGTIPSDWSRTSKGLSLGASLNDLRRIYGTRYQSGTLPANGRRWVVVQWKTENELRVDFDNQGAICHMQLTAPVE
jgi:hypothetical protein